MSEIKTYSKGHIMGLWTEDDPNEIDVFDAPMGNPIWILVGMIIPVGLILYICWKRKKPSNAKAVLCGILGFFVLALIFTIVDALNGYPIIREAQNLKAQSAQDALSAAASFILY